MKNKGYELACLIAHSDMAGHGLTPAIKRLASDIIFDQAPIEQVEYSGGLWWFGSIMLVFAISFCVGIWWL